MFSRKPGRKVNVQDPYYNPGPRGAVRGGAPKINPFSAREDLKGGKIKFFDVPSKSVFSLMFDLHSPQGSLRGGPQLQPGAVSTGNPCGAALPAVPWPEPWQLPGRQCRSLPVSPLLPPCSSACRAAEQGQGQGQGQPGAEAAKQKPLGSWAKKYAVTEIPPFRSRAEREEEARSWANGGGESGNGEAEAMDCSSSRPSPEAGGEQEQEQEQRDGLPNGNGACEDMEAEDEEGLMMMGGPPPPLDCQPPALELSVSAQHQELCPVMLAPDKPLRPSDVISRCDI